MIHPTVAVARVRQCAGMSPEAACGMRPVDPDPGYLGRGELGGLDLADDVQPSVGAVEVAVQRVRVGALDLDAVDQPLVLIKKVQCDSERGRVLPGGSRSPAPQCSHSSRTPNLLERGSRSDSTTREARMLTDRYGVCRVGIAIWPPLPTTRVRVGTG